MTRPWTRDAGRSATSRRKWRAGFTLLEMLVALALMAIISTALYMSLHVAFRARERAEETMAPVRTATLALEIIGRAIESAQPPTGILAGEFIGQDGGADGADPEADSLLLYATAAPRREGVGAVRRVEFLLVGSNDSSHYVLVSHTTLNLLAPRTPDPVEDVLCRNVLGMNFRFFDGSDWLDAWDSTTQDNTMPLAVEVTLTIALPARNGGESGKYRMGRVFTPPCATLPSTGEVSSSSSSSSSSSRGQ